MNRWHVKKEIRVFGLRRSGNHAIINWIIRQSNDQVFFLNNGDILLPFDDHWNYTNPPDNVGLFIHSYEVHRFSPQVLRIANANRDRFFGEPEERYDLLILRDPFNFFASRLKSGYTSAGRSDRYNHVDLWLFYADEFRRKTNYLTSKKVLVNYNQWCKESAYRKDIADQLNIEFTDAGFEDIPKYGGGSSFDGLNRGNSAKKMRTMQRWEEFIDNDNFIDCFRDPRVLWSSKEIFDGFSEVEDRISELVTVPQKAKALVRGLWIRNVIMRLMDYRLWMDRKVYLIR